MINQIKEYKYFLFIITAVDIFAASVMSRYLFHEGLLTPEHWLDYGIHAILWVLSLYYFKFFVVRDLKLTGDFCRSLVNSFCVVFGITLLLRYLYQGSLTGWSIDLYKNVIIFILLALTACLTGIYFLRQDNGWVVIVGGGFTGRAVAREILRSRILNVQIEGFFSNTKKDEMIIYDGDEVKEDKEKVLGRISWLGEEMDTVGETIRRGVRHLIVAKDYEMSSGLVRALNTLRQADVRVYYVDEIFELISRRMPLLHMDKQYFYHIFREIEKKQNEFSLYRVLNRVFNLSSSLIALLVLSPLFALVALVIILESRGPVFFKQTRVGRYGKPFTLYKFRSMRNHDPKNFPKYSTKGDPRVTRFGALIRKLRIDEIPQFINVLRGEMNLIGPRAEWDELVKEYEKEIPFYQQRHIVRPGISGWAQVNYPYGENIEDALYKLQYDLYYIKYRSFILDLKIVIRTIAIMLGGKGQ
ncbi:MAG TPA: sugar transferase [Candidatus Mcinerneyibacteriales bacterium]|nr:sugar transferase [Candidatus Mcinerneyibacteriales bacterium]HPJ70147.1 sugar transferase [Candidatus Mcinerneyibacteriales bacterium]